MAVRDSGTRLEDLEGCLCGTGRHVIGAESIVEHP
jgi:hypothetical protein